MPGRNSRGRLQSQVSYLKGRFQEDEQVTVHSYPLGADDGDTEFLFASDRILVRDDDSALSAADKHVPGESRVGRRKPTEGLAVYDLPGTEPDAIRELIDRINDDAGDAVAGVDHVFHVSSASCCPASEPELVNAQQANPSSSLWPPLNADEASGHDVKVAVIDTGRLQNVVVSTPWLKQPTQVGGWAEAPSLGRYRGHGTFVAGVIRALARSTDVVIYPVMHVGGAIFESELAPALSTVLATKPAFISMSAGTRTTDTDVLVGMEAFRVKLEQTDTILVAAAGNDGMDGPFVPASSGWASCVSVGALDENQAGLAEYTNRGPVGNDWVDVYVRGSDVVNAYPNGVYKYEEDDRTGKPLQANFTNGLASWSGTSFATPIITGLMAAWLSANPGKKPKDAWAAVQTRITQQNGRRVLLNP